MHWHCFEGEVISQHSVPQPALQMVGKVLWWPVNRLGTSGQTGLEKVHQHLGYFSALRGKARLRFPGLTKNLK